MTGAALVATGMVTTTAPVVISIVVEDVLALDPGPLMTVTTVPRDGMRKGALAVIATAAALVLQARAGLDRLNSMRTSVTNGLFLCNSSQPV